MTVVFLVWQGPYGQDGPPEEGDERRRFRFGAPAIQWTAPSTTPTSLNKEVMPFFLGDNGVFPLFLPLAITASGAPEGYLTMRT